MVEAAEGKPLFEATTKRTNASSYELKGSKRTGETANERWPANVIHDGSDEVLAEFAKYGELKSGTLNGTRMERKKNHLYGVFKGKSFYQKREKSLGTAARFFYCAKASPAERNLGCEALPLGEPPKSGRSTPAAGCQSALGRPRPNHHPTVKPLALMAYLVRLVTPPGCLVLDPFMGSGSTLIAAAKEGFDSVGIDLEAEYLDIAAARIQGHLDMLVEISRPHYPYAGSLPKTTL
jgi:site-specific DNA-methyltransferase (adenine-specific)